MDNYEEFFFLAADGELDEAQQQALQRFLRQHPGLEAEFSELASVKLVRDESVVFKDKQTLLKDADKKRVISLSNTWKAFAAAASVSLLIWASVRVGNTFSSVNGGAVLASQTPSPSLQLTKNNLPKTTVLYVEKPGSLVVASKSRMLHHTQAGRSQAPLFAPENATALAALHPTAVQSSKHTVMPENSIAVIKPEMLEMPALTTFQPTSRKAAAKAGLHFNTENVAAIHALKNAAATTIDRINNSPYHLRDLALSLKVGGKTLSINF